MAKITLSSGPSGRVITADDMKTWERIDANEEDTLLNQLIDAATEEAEALTWRKFLTQTWIQYYDNFEDPLVLYYSPASSITSISYTDTNGDSQTLATSVYELGVEHGVSVVRRKYNQDWPTPRSHEDVIAVTFVVGYGTASSVPHRIKQAIRVHAGHRYIDRETGSIPEAFYSLLRPFRLARPQAIGAK